MIIRTKFSIGDTVRVVKDGNFIGIVKEVHADIKNDEDRIWYSITLPEEKRGHGRNRSDSWGYREDWLEPDTSEQKG